MKPRTSVAAVRFARIETTTTPTSMTAAKARMSFHARLSPAIGFLVLIGEPVADPKHGQDVGGVLRIGFDLCPQVLDVRVDGSLIALVGLTLGRRQQLQTGECPARLLDQCRQQAELCRRQMGLAITDEDAMPLEVDLDVGRPKNAGRRWLPLGPPQNGSDSGYDFARTEGLDDVVVGADFQPDQTVSLLHASGDHDDGHVGMAPELTGHIQAVHARKVEIQEYQVGRLVLEVRDGRDSVVDGVNDVSSTLEVVAQ